MRLRVTYATRYIYSDPVSESHNEVRLMPVNDEQQTRIQFQLVTRPLVPIFNYIHPYGRVHYFNLRQRHQELALNAEAVVLTHRRTLFTDLDIPSDFSAFYQQPEIAERYAEFLCPTPRAPLLKEADFLAEQAKAEADSSAPGDILRALMNAIHGSFRYLPGSTTVDTPLAEMLEERAGVCQDFTHLMLSVCRRLGIPSRYVSGYLFTGEQAPPDEQPQRFAQASAEARESSSLSGGNATHAWVECLLPNEQWYGFDPTNNLLANDAYIKIHHGRDYDDVTPLRGVYKGKSETTIEVSVLVAEE